MDAVEETSAIFTASRDLLPAGSAFEPHAHQEDQIAWLAAGAVELEVLGERWHVRGDRIVWIPAGAMHAMRFSEAADLVSLYIDPLLRPEGDWSTPRALRADPLAQALLHHLTDGAPDHRRRARCRGLLADLLAEMPVVRDVIALPRDERARTVAAALLQDPGDARDLDAWARELGVSTKTLARAFVHGTGVTFRRWRVDARMHAGARMLADGVPVQDAARAVGYISVSSFIVAFRQRFQTTPARYAAALRAA
ncbi:AraC family transcriptional regulator [Microbacterium sp.]|uniref:helix-turn-helix transcriptional regulator n=1 Tax=Microbacterium sp. TaxID=51671 RepID=UPI0039E2F550